MKRVIINQDSLAHHLGIVADHYEPNAASCQDAGHGGLAISFAASKPSARNGHRRSTKLHGFRSTAITSWVEQ